MNQTKLSVGFVGLLAFFASGVAIFQVRARHETEVSLATAQRENEGLAARLRAVQARAIAAEQGTAALQKSLADLRAARTAEEARAGRAAGARTGAPRLSTPSTVEGEAFMARHPEVRVAVLDLHRTQIAGQFGAFFKAHRFTAEQIEAFTAAMKHGAGVMRMVPGEDGKPFVLSVPSWGDADKRREEEAQLGALLGEAGIRDLRTYVQELPARKLAAQLAGALYFTPTPLTPLQAEQVMRTITASRAETGGQSGGALNWNAILAGARAVLSEPQLAVLVGFQAQEHYNLAMNQAMRRASQPERSTDASGAPGK